MYMYMLSIKWHQWGGLLFELEIHWQRWLQSPVYCSIWMMNEVHCWCCAGEAWVGAAAHSPSQRLVRPYRPGRAAEEPLERFLNRITAAVLTAQDVTELCCKWCMPYTIVALNLMVFAFMPVRSLDTSVIFVCRNKDYVFRFITLGFH